MRLPDGYRSASFHFRCASPFLQRSQWNKVALGQALVRVKATACPEFRVALPQNPSIFALPHLELKRH